MIPRNDWIYLESFPDECRNTPLNLEPRLVVPDCAKEPSRLSTVLAVGPKVCDVSIGDIVLTRRYGGAKAKDSNGLECFFMKEEEIDAKVNK